MHVRLGSSRGRRRLSSGRSGLHSTLPLLVLALQAGTLGAGCRQQPPRADVTLESSITPAPPALGAATLTIRLLDAARRPVSGARLQAEVQMSHPGMGPAVTTAVERAAGVYEAPLQFTMRGDWVVLVSGTLPGGETVRHQIDIKGVR